MKTLHVLLIWGLLLDTTAVQAKPRTAPDPPASALTQDEHVCQLYGEMIALMAHYRDQGVSYLRALAVLRKQRWPHPDMRAPMENMLRIIYDNPTVPPGYFRTRFELKCTRPAEATE